jgi:CRP/FNR family transcriptional regulator, cyclic AMP receptor protein
VTPTNSDPATLSGKSHFRGLPTRELERLAPLLHKRRFLSGANVITAEEKGDSVYVILEGTAKVYVAHTDGTEVILAILGPGEIVGEMSAADSLGRSASVLTLEDSTLLWMDRHTFLSSMEEMPTIARNLIGILSRRLRLADTNTRSLAALE